jgi:hypothetical protein
MQTQFAGGNNYEYSPPRPYVWKTDEFQVADGRAKKSKQINQVQPLANFQPNQNVMFQPQPAINSQPAVSYGYRCPRCSSQLFPRTARKISTAGWIVFAVLLVSFFPLFWIGLLIKEDVRVCPVCNLTSN